MKAPAIPLNEARLAELIRTQRWGAMATLDNGLPYVSWVAFCPAHDHPSLLFHLSGLARHTRNLSADPNISIAISEPDRSDGDPQLLARLTLQGRVAVVSRDAAEYGVDKAAYLQRLPDAEPMFDFQDFNLFRFVPESGRYIEGFGRAYSLGEEQIQAALITAAA